jgi:hypothetical protein
VRRDGDVVRNLVTAWLIFPCCMGLDPAWSPRAL